MHIKISGFDEEPKVKISSKKVEGSKSAHEILFFAMEWYFII
jgi:hypothetical protein